MGWFGDFVEFALLSVGLAMLSYHGWRSMRRRRFGLEDSVQMSFWALIGLVSWPDGFLGFDADVSSWLALALAGSLLIQVALSEIRERRSSKPPHEGSGGS